MDERSSSLYKKQCHRDALDQKIEFYRHNISNKDKEELLKVLDSIFLTTGEIVNNFESKFANYLNSKYAVGVTSCTNALELVLRYFNIGPGDEVITTPMSFVATANVIEYVGAKPVFVDVEKSTGNIDINFIESAITNKTKAIIPVHLYGHMCDMRAMRTIADKYNLRIIEDAAHCVEGERDGIKPGQLGDAACFSFYATKNLTCGEGGAIVCNDLDMYEWLFMGRGHGITKNAAQRYTKKFEFYDMTFLGMKCNMSNIQAALLINQLDNLDSLWQDRKKLTMIYNTNFNSLINLKRPTLLSNTKHAWHLYTIWVDAKKRSELLSYFQDFGVGVAVNYKPIHLMDFYKRKYGYKLGDFPVAENLGDSTISLPLYPSLTLGEIHRIIEIVVSFFN